VTARSASANATQARWLGVVLFVVAAGLVAATAVWVLRHAHTEGSQFGAYDLGVHRAAARALVHGEPIYDRFLTPVAPYSYPPIAAVVAIPLLAMPLSAERWLWMLVQLASLGVVAYVSAAAIRRRRPDMATVVAVLLFAGVVATLPMRSSLRDGQVNAVLLCLIVCDVLVERPRWPRGLLVGIAAAIKLTPALVIVYWLLTDRRRPALHAVYTFAALTAVGFLTFPRLSFDFWAHHVTSPSEGIALDATDNQSLRGVAERLTSEHAVLLWVLTALVIAIVGLLLARAQWRRDDDVAGLAIVLLTAVLVSPIGWIHYGVVFILVGAVLMRDAVTGRAHPVVLVAALVGLEAALLFDIPRVRAPHLLRDVTQNWFALVILVSIVALGVRRMADRRLSTPESAS